MKYVTFNQALLAVGLLGLTLALTNAEGNSFGIAASLLVDDGPSIGAPVVLLAVSIALPLIILAVAIGRLSTATAGGEAREPLTYAEARIAIALTGLSLLASFAPQLVTVNTNAGWDESILSVVYLVVALVILAAILGIALGDRTREPGPFGLPQVLRCVALIALVIAAVVAPGLNGVLVAGSTVEPDLIARKSSLAFGVHAIAAVAAIVVILLVLRLRSGMGPRSAIAAAALLLAISGSVQLGYTLTVGLALAALVATAYFGSRAEDGSAAPVRNGPLLASLGVLGLVINASTIKYVISLYHACAKFDASLYLWPTLALVAAVLFSLGLTAVGVARVRAGNGAAGVN
ncbi:MAG: hypothetical protein OXH07_09565 [Chloroflexi bacterium]|nr:hypothetical protein [Chloroflexota bacterium]